MQKLAKKRFFVTSMICSALVLHGVGCKSSGRENSEVKEHFDSLSSLSRQYHSAFDYAFSPSGLNLSRDEARQWAKTRMESAALFRPGVSLIDQFKESYQLAYDPRTLDLDDVAARAWAEQLLKNRGKLSLSDDLKQQYGHAYQLAYDREGLNMSDDAAQVWAR